MKLLFATLEVEIGLGELNRFLLHKSKQN
ncbi:hypothetical protein A406_0386 [Listeria monocytogenes serotype 4b str. 81-0592]|nr:hypothetical protein LMOf2365_0323 [Listeria monocytogenes serotype 4b str. F2365]ASH31369.1 hypothetical protein A408_0387 [Listeria monocytogenes serotype 4b str. 10-0809]ASH66053.1 hypothetical protein A417_0386 [Listeria monocytogenes serotype 4b str. 02-1103]ASH68971.1 hypothetical protein A418_0386 [Listeria monocytogenes serotype 4b str. 02-1289]ASH71890.1 hypothetical protein A419_0387 [Listeria monocytogenes serotype 4b str. 02-1792]ASH77626.1 hypothetical protein A405_0378 [Lister